MHRRGFLRALGGTGLLLGGAPLFAACGAPEQQTAARRLVLRQTVEPANNDPAFAPGRSDYEVMACIYDGLQSLHPDQPRHVRTLAEQLDISDDATQIRFALKKGIPFHEGYGEVTAEDVKFSYERIAGITKPDLESPYAEDWSALREVQVTGRYTGVIHLKHPFAPLLETTLPLERGYVLSKRAVEDRGEGYATAPIGTGPYQVVEYEPRRSIVLRRFADYGGARHGYSKPVEWDEIEFRPVFNDSSAAIGLTTGEIDFGDVSPTDVARFAAEPGYEVARVPTYDYRFIGMNETHPRLKDKRVREAVRLAVDVDAILAAAFEDTYDRATAIVPPQGTLGFWDGAPKHPRDLDAARSLLADAGAQGLHLTMTSSTDQPGSDVICQIVQANLAEVGVDVTVDVQDPGTFWTLGGKVQKERQLFYCGFSGLPDPYWSTVWFTCDQVDVWNFQSFCDKRFSSLHEQAVRTVDAERRDRMYQEMQKIWDSAANTIWVTWPTNLFAYRDGLRPSIRMDGRPMAWNFRGGAA